MPALEFNYMPFPRARMFFDLVERLKDLLTDEFEPEFDDDIQIDFEEYSE